MKTLKILLLCLIPILGIYSMNKIGFGKKLVLVLPGDSPGQRHGQANRASQEVRQNRANGKEGSILAGALRIWVT